MASFTSSLTLGVSSSARQRPCPEHRGLVYQQLHRRRRGYATVPVNPAPQSFTDTAHIGYYAVCGKKQHKRAHKAIKRQRDRLKELVGRFEGDGATADLGMLATVVSEMQELSENMLQVSEMAMDSSSSSSSSEDDCDSMPAQQASSTPVSTAALMEASETDSLAEALLAGVRGGGAQQPLLDSLGLPSVAWTQLGKENNIVAAPQETAQTRVAVCQGKACVKRGAAQVLAAATREAAAHGGRVQVAPCKCLDKCKAGPNVSVRAPGAQRTMLTGVRPEMVPSIMQGSAQKQPAEQRAC